MSKRINENLIKISAGYITVAQELELDTDITLMVNGAVVKCEDRSNQDGTVNRIYTIKGIIAEVSKDGKRVGTTENKGFSDLI